MSNRTQSFIQVAQMGTFWVACDTFLGISAIGHSAGEAYRAVSDAIVARLEAKFPASHDMIATC